MTTYLSTLRELAEMGLDRAGRRAFLGVYDTPKTIIALCDSEEEAKEYLEDYYCEELEDEIPEDLRYYMDWEKFVKDKLLSGYYYIIEYDGGALLCHG